MTSQYPPAVEIPPPMYARHAQSDSLEYARGGVTPPAPLDTPAPGRPAYGMPMAAAGYGAPPQAYAAAPVPQQPAYSALPTPVPPPRAPVLPGGLIVEATEPGQGPCTAARGFAAEGQGRWDG